MYAVIESGGRQHKVEVGQTVDVDLLPAEAGETIELGRVLLLSQDDEVTVGQPAVAGAKVLAEVVGEVRGQKVIVFKYKAKVRYRRKLGHRQSYTRVVVRDIQTGSDASEQSSGAQADAQSAGQPEGQLEAQAEARAQE